jgi:hypothetical protein
MSGNARGGDDVLLGDRNDDDIIGDAGESMSGNARGGNDIITADPAARFGQVLGTGINVLIGDARTMFGNARGGDDIITAVGLGGILDVLAVYGDAGVMSGCARGGDDIVVSGGSGRVHPSFIYGDAGLMEEQARGGNDDLRIDGNSSSRQNVIGDAYEMRGHARAGNDRIETGSGDDQLWGDAVLKDETVITGRDTFVFGPASGHDVVHDFERGKDKIDLTAFAALGIHSFDDVDWEVVSGSIQIQLSGDTEVTLAGVSGVAKGDFFFA